VAWNTLFLAGAVLSALLLPILALAMPESTALHRERPLAASPLSVLRDLLAGDRRRDSLRLWIAVFSAFMTLYFIVSWIPRLAIEAGLDASHGIYAGAIYNIGAFTGTAGLAWLADRFRLKRLIGLFLLSSAVLLVAFGALRLPVAAELLLAFAIGVTLQGGFNGLYPLAASAYPAERRSAGLGWAMGIGRAGAVIGPLLGGYLLSQDLPLVLLFAVFALPVVVSAACARGIRPAA
jgi:predicted MFS family arabinose efflux permease